MNASQIVNIRTGAFHIRGFLNCKEQQRIEDACIELGRCPNGFYQPVLRTGARMRLRMMCLGRHWNAKRYMYEDVRGDVDRRPVHPLPAWLAEIARQAASAVQMRIQPDIALVNYYDAGGRLGLHRDNDESPETIATGVPVVSLSVGDDAEFVFGGTRRADPLTHILLCSGDAFVFGGPARLCYHGINRLRTGTCREPLSLTGRLNVTFRQF